MVVSPTREQSRAMGVLEIHAAGHVGNRIQKHVVIQMSLASPGRPGPASYPVTMPPIEISSVVAVAATIVKPTGQVTVGGWSPATQGTAQQSAEGSTSGRCQDGGRDPGQLHDFPRVRIDHW